MNPASGSTLNPGNIISGEKMRRKLPIEEGGGGLYICLSCFEAFTARPPDHPHSVSRLILCDPGNPGDERRKPVSGSRGIPLTHAPRWYLEALGMINREA
jgi:hypothetical protein